MNKFITDSDPCISRESIRGYLLGVIEPEQADHIEHHLQACLGCEKISEELAGYADDFLTDFRRGARHGVGSTALPLNYIHRLYDLGKSIGSAEADTDRWATAAPEFVGGAVHPALEEVGGQLREYQLVSMLGRGGMGVVYRALHNKLKKEFAVKVMRSDSSPRPETLARFEREMEAVGKLNHPHIVQATDAGEWNGRHFLVMELVEGLDLVRLVRELGRLEIADACEIIRQAAEGLHHAQQRGLVHRDIKPSNLMLSALGQVKILDLGLALLQSPENGDALQTRVTTEHHVLGTPEYMSPEQWDGALGVDASTDVYSLGCTLFFLLTGEPPYPAVKHHTRARLMLAHLHAEIPNIQTIRADVPTSIADLLRGMLAKSATDRGASVSEVARVLAPFAQGANLPALAQRLMQAQPEEAWETPQLEASTSQPTKNPAVPRSTPRLTKRAFALAGGTVMLVAGVLIALNGGFRAGHADAKGPISDAALAKNPAAIPGVLSWTPETEAYRGEPRTFEFSPDRTKLAVASEFTPRVYDVPTGKLLHAFVGHSRAGAYVHAVAWSADSEHLVSVSRLGEVILWNVPNRKKIASFWDRRFKEPLSVAWSGDGKQLALGSRNTVGIWNPFTGQQLDRLTPPGENPVSLRWSKNGHKLAAASRDGKVWIWDRQTGKIVQEFATKDRPTDDRQLEWSPDDSLLAHFSCDNENPTPNLLVWDSHTGKPHADQNLFAAFRHSGHPDHRRRFLPHWSVDGKTLAGVFGSGGYWDFRAAGKKLVRQLFTDKGDRLAVPLGWTSDGKTWLSSDIGYDGHVKVWNFGADRPLWTRDRLPDVHARKRSPDSKLHALVSGDKLVRVVDDATGKILHQTSIGYVCQSLEWSPDNQALVITGGGECYFYELKTDRLTPFGAGSSWAASKDWTTLAVRDFNKKRVLISERSTGKKLDEFPDEGMGDGNDIGPIAIAPISGAVTLGTKKGIRLYDIAKKSHASICGDAGPVWALAWSPDEKQLILSDTRLAIWDVQTQRPVRTMEILPDVPFPTGPALANFKLAWAPDGKTISLTHRRGGQTFEWDAKTGKLLRHGETVAPPSNLRFVALANEQFLALSPEGHYRGTPNATQHIVYVVETASGQETLTPAEMEKKYGWKNDPEKVRPAP